MKKAVVIAAVCVLIAGCTNTDVRTDNWSLNMSRLLTDTEFDRAVAVIDPNGRVHITFEKFKSEQQQMLEVIGAALAAGK